MCGRFTLTKPIEAYAQAFELSEIASLCPRYNIAPTQPVFTVVQEPGQPQRQCQWMRWGLIPWWAKDPKIGNRLINARAETLREKPSFRNAIRNRRCLIVADGFYEWQRLGKHKQPYHIRLKSGQPFALAGLWEVWQPGKGEVITSCTIITTPANELMQTIHHRMPAILPPEAYPRWLDSATTDTASLQNRLCPYESELMEAIPVRNTVNNPAKDGPECIAPLS